MAGINGNGITPLAVTHKLEILERLGNGELVREIAAHFNISREQISRTLAHDPEYREALNEALEARLEQRVQEVERAEDGITLARADKLLVHARWEAERRNPGVWGQQKQAIQVQTDGAATINIVSWADPPEPQTDLLNTSSLMLSDEA